jgi:hypothetical protein
MLRKAILVFCLAVACVSAGTAAQSSEPETLQWVDLQQAETDLSDPFADLPDDQYDALILLLRLRDIEAAESPLLKSAGQRRQDLSKKFKHQGVDLDVEIRKYDTILARRRKTAEAGVTELEARNISITGYVLPITVVGGNQAQEFLLVQSPAACSHTRLPLPNQTILVKPEVPYTFKQYFEHVTVSGPINLQVQKHSLYLLDGRIAVTSAYGMNGAAAMQVD